VPAPPVQSDAQGGTDGPESRGAVDGEAQHLHLEQELQYK